MKLGCRSPIRLSVAVLAASLPLLWACQVEEPDALRADAVPPNVLLISIDTLRPDHLSTYGYARSTSPQLDAWTAAYGQLFETAITTSPWTLPAHLSLFTGLEASSHGINHTQPVPQELRLLAERFQTAGYTTAAFTGGGFLHPEFAFEQGFDRFEAWEGARKAPEEFATGIEGALQILENRIPGAPPFFLFLHTYEVHEPYRARQPHFDRLSDYPAELEVRLRQNPLQPATGRQITKVPALIDPVRQIASSIPPELAGIAVDLYDSGVASMDAQLGAIWESLSQTGLQQSTIVVFTSDHGELLGEHGVAGHSYFWEENLRIPLVVSVPGRPAARHAAPIARLIDIAPTLLELCGLEPDDSMEGRSLAPWLLDSGGGSTESDSWSYSSKPNSWIALRRRGLKYVLRTDPYLPAEHRESFFDLRRDPGERNDQLPEQIATLRQLAEGKLTENPPAHRLEIVNREPRALGFLLGGTGVPPARVKTPQRENPTLQVVDEQTVGEVPAGTSLVLILEATIGAPLELSVWIEGQEADAIGGAWTLTPTTQVGITRSAGRWTRVEAEAEIPDVSLRSLEATRVLLLPHGSAIRAQSPELPNELQEQLRALGYVE